MAKVMKCLNADCTKYYVLDDGSTVHVPKDTCEVPEVDKGRSGKERAQEWKKDFKALAKATKQTIYLSEDPEWEVGDESVLNVGVKKSKKRFGNRTANRKKNTE